MLVLEKHSHTFILASVVLVASMFGLGLYALLIMSGFYIGREHSQAEYRYMKLKGINRSGLKLVDAFKKEAWSYDSLVNDLIMPVVVGIIIILIQYKGF